MIVFYDIPSRCWFLKLNGRLMYVPDPDLVWDASVDKAVTMHASYPPGRENDLELQSKIGKLVPLVV